MTVAVSPIRHLCCLAVLVGSGAISFAPQAAAQQGCGEAFVAALETCQPASCQFKHPLTGKTMEQRVVRLNSDGTCEYTQQMPDGGMMTCNFSEETRTAMAGFFRQLASGASVESKVDSRLSLDQSGGTTSGSSSTRVNGAPVENTLAQAMASGACQISGYGG